MSKQTKLAQRQTYSNGHIVSVGLTGSIGYISIEDNNLYPDSDSRAERRDLGYNRIMIPLMTRADLNDLRIAIDEVLKNSK
jgi:hypothetical protein